MNYSTGYSFLTGLKKTLIQMAIFGLPMVVTLLPETWMNLTVGGILALIVNYLKFQFNASEPNK